MPNAWDRPVDDPVRVVLERLFGPGIGSSNRLERMLVALVNQPPEVAWPVFFEMWPSCDDTWRLRRELLLFLRPLHQRSPGVAHLADAERAFLDGLHDPVRVFRGCSRSRARGVSWSTDRATAEQFARGHRSIPVPDPVVAEADVPKTAIFSVMLDRGECEVVLDPRRLRHLVLTPYAPLG